jgi:hypothetical protein
MPTIRDLVKKCPGCGESAVYPFTQSFDLNSINFREGRAATSQETDLIQQALERGTGLQARELKNKDLHASEIGTRIKTLKIGSDLWHEPCYLMKQLNDQDKALHGAFLSSWPLKAHVERITAILNQAIAEGKFP